MTTVFQWTIEWAADSDPNLRTTGFRGIILGRRTEFDVDGRRIDCAADSGPNSMTTVFRLGWMIDWAADADPNSMTTGSWTRAGPENRIPRRRLEVNLIFKFESDGG